MAVGEEIKKKRDFLGISQKQLSQKANISQSSIHYIESGQNSPTIETLEKIAIALGITVIDLLVGNSPRDETCCINPKPQAS